MRVLVSVDRVVEVLNLRSAPTKTLATLRPKRKRLRRKFLFKKEMLIMGDIFKKGV
jgi:hypothetical protein